MSHAYPRMLYLGGDTSARHLVVKDAEAEKAAAANGYYAAGKPTKAPAPAKKAARKATKKRRA